MTIIEWDPKAREFLRKLPKTLASRIYRKVRNEISKNVYKYLEKLVGKEGYKIRYGTYRLFVTYNKKEDILCVEAIKKKRI